MKRLLTLAVAMGIGLVTGCSVMDIDDVTTTTTRVVKNVPETVTEHKVEFGKASLLMNSAFDQASLDYGPAKLRIGGYSNVGDTATTRTIADGIVGGITAYFTAGASSVAKGVVKGMSASSVADTVREELETPTEAPETPLILPTEDSAPPPKPIDISPDVQKGKNGIVILGNRRGCPLCRALWKGTFESDVESALLNADVVDADLGDNPKLYSKYFTKEVTLYPWALIFDTNGKQIGSFAVRNMSTVQFVEKVEAICPACKP